MERFFTFWSRYLPLSEQDRQFIQQHGRVRRYRKNQYYLFSGEFKLTWCFLLDGLVAGTETSRRDKDVIYWICAKGDYFSGTKHPFSMHGDYLNIRFLQDSEVLEIPNFRIQERQQDSSILAELMQILKQRKLNQYRQLLRILKLEPGERFSAMMDELPHLIYPLTVSQRISFLAVDKTIYYRSLAAYIRKK